MRRFWAASGVCPGEVRPVGARRRCARHRRAGRVRCDQARLRDQPGLVPQLRRADRRRQRAIPVPLRRPGDDHPLDRPTGDRTAADFFTEANIAELERVERRLRDSDRFDAVVSPITAMTWTERLITPRDPGDRRARRRRPGRPGVHRTDRRADRAPPARCSWARRRGRRTPATPPRPRRAPSRRWRRSTRLGAASAERHLPLERRVGRVPPRRQRRAHPQVAPPVLPDAVRGRADARERDENADARAARRQPPHRGRGRRRPLRRAGHGGHGVGGLPPGHDRRTDPARRPEQLPPRRAWPPSARSPS